MDGNLVLELKSKAESELRRHVQTLKAEEAAVLALLRSRLPMCIPKQSYRSEFAGPVSPRHLHSEMDQSKKRQLSEWELRGVVPSAKSHAKALAVRQERSRERASNILPAIRELQASGAVSLRAIARASKVRTRLSARSIENSVR
jgi:hypothetical protein